MNWYLRPLWWRIANCFANIFTTVVQLFKKNSEIQKCESFPTNMFCVFMNSLEYWEFPSDHWHLVSQVAVDVHLPVSIWRVHELDPRHGIGRQLRNLFFFVWDAQMFGIRFLSRMILRCSRFITHLYVANGWYFIFILIFGCKVRTQMYSNRK